jgi:phytol kinase
LLNYYSSILVSFLLKTTGNLHFWLSIGLATLYLLILVLTAELLNRLSPSPAEVTRKLVHIGAGQVVLIAWWLAIPGWVGAIAGLLAAVIAIMSYRLPILPSLESVGRHSYGTLFYAISMGGLVGVFFSLGQPVYAVIGILVMAWGDGLAALVGQRWGKHPYRLFGSNKSWEGSGAMALVGFAITTTLLAIHCGASMPIVLIGVIVALVSTGLETFSHWGIDNLTVPVGSSLAAFCMAHFYVSCPSY